MLNPEILAELRKGNTEVLNSLPPLIRMQYGLALQDEQGQKDESPINDKDLSKAMLDRLKDSGVKERLIKEIEEKRQQEQKDKRTLSKIGVLFYLGGKGKMSIKNTVIECSKLAEKNCSNFFNGKCQGEKRCHVFNSTMNKGLRCPYFEESVLPVDSDLQEAYSVHILGQGANYSSKKCKGCSKVFKTDNYRIQYCSDGCRNIGKKKANRKADRKYRKNEKSAINKA